MGLFLISLSRQRRLQRLDRSQSYFLTYKRVYHELSFSESGSPEKVLNLHHIPSVSIPKASKVRVAMQYVPWNPADVNVVQGRYPSPGKKPGALPSLVSSDHTVAGSGGVGIVQYSESAEFHVGDWVTVAYPGMGTLRTLMSTDTADCWLRLPSKFMETVGPAGSTLFQLGGTAWRMLHDFQSLSKGDWIIQNAGNSAVGLMVSQLAALLGVRTVSLVRKAQRNELELQSLKDHVYEFGKASLVLCEDELIRDKKRIELDGPVKLALNAVGGESSKLLVKTLSPNGSHVTYGGMAERQPNYMNAGELIFLNKTMAGYWHSRWMLECQREKHQQMTDWLVEMALQKKISCPPCKIVPLTEFRDALIKVESSSTVREKTVFDLSNEDKVQV